MESEHLHHEERWVYLGRAFLRYDPPVCAHPARQCVQQSSANEMALLAWYARLWDLSIPYGSTISVVRTDLGLRSENKQRSHIPGHGGGDGGDSSARAAFLAVLRATFDPHGTAGKF